MAEDLITALDDSDLPRRGRAIVLGHSMGGQVALEAYRRWPGRIAGLVLVACTYENPLKTFMGSSLAERAFPFAYLGMRAVPEFLQPMRLTMGIEPLAAAGPDLYSSADHVSQEELGPYLRHLRDRDPGFLVLSPTPCAATRPPTSSTALPFRR